MTEQELRKIFANNLKYYRTMHEPKMTQEHLSELLDKNKNYIGLLEKEKTSLPLDMLAQISQILDVEPAQLLEKKGSPKNIATFNTNEFIQMISKSVAQTVSTQLHSEITQFIK